MLVIYDKNKNKLCGLDNYSDLCIESTLSNGDKVLSFLYPSSLFKNSNIELEGYIRTKEHEFVTKELNDDGSGQWKLVKGVLNLEELEGKEWEHFDTTEQTIEASLNLALAGTGWTLVTHGTHTKKRTIRVTNKSTLEIIAQAKRTYLVEISYDTINKVVNIYNAIGSDKGAYFIDSLNLKKLTTQENSYEFFTRMLCIGATTVSEDGTETTLKTTLENHQYSNKNKTYIWKDERYTNFESLIEDGTYKLDELSKPYSAFLVDVIDLAKISNKYSILSYSLGDTLIIINNKDKRKEKQRIVKSYEYPDEPYRNSCEISNTVYTFEEIQNENFQTTEIVNNITSDDGNISPSAINGIISKLSINFADIQSLNAVEIRVGDLEATTAKITDLTAVNAKIDNLEAKKANIVDLTANNIKVDLIEGGTAILQNILTNFISGESGQFIHLTGANVVIDNAVIKDAMIETLSLSKLLAGDISTNKFRIVSYDGKMLISDNTMQISDSSRVRVQIGKDASNDYSLYVWDGAGNLMFDALGLKADGIKDKIIRNEMVSDNANISGSKLDITSLITCINSDNTNTLKSTKIKLDDVGQTLDVAFNALTTKVDDNITTTTANTTAINASNGRIDTIISNTTITKEDGAVVQLKDAYNSTVATVNSINSTLAEHATKISSNTSGIENVTTKANTLERSLNETIIKVSSLESAEAINLIKNYDFKLWDSTSSLPQDWTYVEDNSLETDPSDQHYYINKDAGACIHIKQEITTNINVALRYIAKIDVKTLLTQPQIVTVRCTLIVSTSGGDVTGATGYGTLTIQPNSRTVVTVPMDLDVASINSSDRIYIEYKVEGSAGLYEVKFIENTVGNYATTASVAELSIKTDTIEQTVTSNKTDADGKISSLQSQLTTQVDTIQQTVTNNKTDLDGKINSLQGQITTQAGQITLKTSSNDVKSIIQQNPSDIVIGFNKVSKRFKFANDGFRIYDDAGNVVFYPDSSGNVCIRGKIYADPANPLIKLFDQCSLDATNNNELGVGSAVRLKWDIANYLLITAGLSTFYNNNGTVSISNTTEGHACIQPRSGAILKMLTNSNIVQARNNTDTAYGAFHAADFVNKSSERYKTNIQTVDVATLVNILKANNIKQYNLKEDVQQVINTMGLDDEVAINDVDSSSADVKMGLILEELTPEARALLSPDNSEGIDLYTMISLLWSVVQDQQKILEALKGGVSNGT